MTDELGGSIGAGTTAPAVERPGAVRSYWDERARLGERAGTHDLIAKQLEQRAILGAMADMSPRYVLEIGCGTGETARLVSDTFGACLEAVDSSPEMISAARASGGRLVNYWVGDIANPVETPLNLLYRFDVVYTERCLINLPTWEAQKAAIDAIAERLVSGGKFIMCENSENGLNAINQARALVKLGPIAAPWHNRYFIDAELETITSLKLLKVVPFSATYYYHSRVLNAALSEVPSYEARINKLALELPADCVDPRFAQGRLFVWEKQ